MVEEDTWSLFPRSLLEITKNNHEIHIDHPSLCCSVQIKHYWKRGINSKNSLPERDGNEEKSPQRGQRNLLNPYTSFPQVLSLPHYRLLDSTSSTKNVVELGLKDVSSTYDLFQK